MFVVISYDIPDDRRRTRVMKLLQNYGQRVQYSVFECDLTPQQYAALRRDLAPHLHAGLDSMRYYALCRACKQAIEFANSPAPATSPTFYLT